MTPISSERRLVAEQMDRPGLDLRLHRQALRGLGRLNGASAVAGQLWRRIERELHPRPGDRLRLLDIASGGGDMAFRLWRRARRRHIQLEVFGLDKSPIACTFATRRCQAAGESIAFQVCDVISDPLPQGFDVVTCSLFLHHLTAAQAVLLLQKMTHAARLVVVSDLRRGLAGYALAHAACRTLTRSSVVHHDGPQSVANAFSLTEMRALCDAAGLRSASVRPAWPCRMLVLYPGASDA
jgi:2-polyprenyl-3-methyl-5-hydroxy-6-metoxy-1,4-benzoquinol methylase